MFITTWNRASLLDGSLGVLAGLTLPDELIVVDDDSTDDTQAVCEKWAEHLPLRYVYNKPRHRGTCCQQWNVGIRAATGDYVLHAHPETEFLSDLVAQFREAVPEFPERILVPHHSYIDGYEDCPLEDSAYCGPADGLHAHGGGAHLYKRDWMLEVGGYDESFGPGGWDDLDFHMRLEWAGHTHVGVPGAVTRHRWHPRMDWEGSEGASNGPLVQAKRREDLVANAGTEWGVPLS